MLNSSTTYTPSAAELERMVYGNRQSEYAEAQTLTAHHIEQAVLPAHERQEIVLDREDTLDPHFFDRTAEEVAASTEASPVEREYSPEEVLQAARNIAQMRRDALALAA